MTAGLGTLEVTEAKIREAIDELSERGEVTEREAKQIVSEWAERLREQQKRLRSELEEAARQAVAKSPFVRRTDFDRLKRRIDALERKLKGEGNGDEEC
jgi:polyhydroxyalkanoate synthesis regulator phasin